jgi:NADH-quinone oxidoreductase subunit N
VTASDLPALLPLLITSGAAVALLLLLAFYRDHAVTLALTLLGLAAACATLWVPAQHLPHRVGDLLTVDGYALFFQGLLFAGAFALALLGCGYLQRRGRPAEEMYVLLLLATTGAAVLVAASHFASFFLGLEILSVSLYAMIAYLRGEEPGLEAAVKYLVLAAVAAAFLLFGMALIYAQSGSLGFAHGLGVTAGPEGGRVLLLAGLALLAVGIGFKLALVPFHLWTPDVYQGAPAPVAAFIATVSKGAVFALLLRLVAGLDPGSREALLPALAVLAVLSMLGGNLLALLQQNVKRLLAYSSIAHLGYLLVPLLAGGPLAITAASFYLAAYFATTLGAWGVLTVLSGEREAQDLADFQGLAWRRPWLGAAFTVALLSLAGIPLTAGFLGKFYLLATGVYAHLWPLVMVLVVSSALGLFYYLRLLVVIFARPAGALSPDAEPAPPAREPSTPWPAGLALAGLVGLTIWLGVYPSPLLNLLQVTAQALAGK